MKKLEPGIYEMSQADYLKYPAYSRTNLVEALETAADAEVSRRFQKEETDQMRLGTATHLAFFEPEKLLRHFSLWKGRRQGKDWDAHKASALKQGRDPFLTEAQYQEALSMCESLKLWGKTKRLFAREPSQKEVTIIFDLAINGITIPLKVRLDFLIRDRFPTQVDLKTSASVTDLAFHKSIVDYGYDIQSWLYRKAFVKLTDLPVTNSLIVAVEKNKQRALIDGKRTHAVRVFEMKPFLELGRNRALKALAVIAGGIRTQEWPSYPDQVEVLEPSDWYQRKWGVRR